MSLIEELEKAEKPSRELDAAIAEASGWIRVEADKFFAESWLNPDEEDAILPTFSSSIDAALTLVPEGQGYGLMTVDDVFHFGIGDTDGQASFYSVAATPAIAICIAALRAREATNGTT